MTDSSRTPPPTRPGAAVQDGSARTRLHRWAPRLMLVYLTMLVLIAFWPAPVDRNSYAALLSVIDWLQERYATLSDVIANTIGAAAGTVLGLVLLRGGRAR